ncbi:MAG TPA: SHOCT domain-containing protein [Nocardioides sp.]|nr:SHOCT domain-containing protein [Nocardioides sp.]
MMYGYYGGHMGAGPWVMMAVTDLLFWAVLAVLIYRLLTSGALHRPTRQASDTPSDVLAHRFARGEIDAEEYAARRRVLDGEGR